MRAPTPGPWHVADGAWDGSTSTILDGRNHVLARVLSVIDGDKRANALVMAAGAELLESAKSVISQFEQIKTHQHKLLDHGLAAAECNWDEATLGQYIEFAPIIAAIAKAEGRS